MKATGRPIVFSLCQYGLRKVWEWGAASGGNLWRTTGDIEDRWKSMATIGFDKQVGLEQYAGPGHWNDPDMLEIGNGRMDEVEYRTHMSLWAMLAAPLLAGNDLRSMSDETKQILHEQGSDRHRSGQAGPPGLSRFEGRPARRSGQSRSKAAIWRWRFSIAATRPS